MKVKTCQGLGDMRGERKHWTEIKAGRKKNEFLYYEEGE